MTSTPETFRCYRFGFVLTTAAGNQTRYLNLRKYTERDPEVDSVWAPITHWIDSNPFRRLPGPLQTRAIVARQADPVMSRLSSLDAVMFHAFEPYVWAVLRGLFFRRPLVVWSQDNPPLSDPGNHPQARYGDEYARSDGRRRVRFWFDRWCARRTGLFFPFSTWAASVLAHDCGVPAERIHPIHVGLDLENWPYVPQSAVTNGANERAKILFVGGDFARKGGPLLIDVFARNFARDADLHIVTKAPVHDAPEHVFQHCGLQPGDPRLNALYAQCDMFVLPTLADMSSWVALEAMATGRPVIISGTGGIPDIVDEGKTGFVVPPGNGQALTERIRCLLDNSDLRVLMGEAGRSKVEREFNASVCVPRILAEMKANANRRG